MVGTILKWVIPGLVTVLGGTALAVAQTGAAITTDLGTRSDAALSSADFAWAHVDVDGRDAVLSGTATTQAKIDDAIAHVASVRGVRGVESHVALAEYVSPFPFSASIKSGAVTLSGAYPDESVHAALLATASGARDETKLYSGAPDSFATAAKFGLGALADLDDGEVKLADLSLTVTGRAKSPAAFAALQTLQQSAPASVKLAALTVTPPLAAPYVWTAKFDGTTVTIDGNAPTTDLAERLRAVAPANVPVSANLALASGEPQGFEANTLAILKSLLSLENGEATISDASITLTGAPSSVAVADDVASTLSKLGGTASLAPPRVADFALHIDKSADRLVFTGFVPDAATRDKLTAIAGADTSKLELGRGAPQQFAAALDFGLGALGHLGEGEFGIKNDRMSIGGRAATLADFSAATEMVAQGAPQGLSLAAAELHPPVAKPFTWSATRDAAGKIALAGYVPDEATRKSLAARIANPGTDAAVLADGAPIDFATSAENGLAVLALLDTGSVNFDGANWSIEGAVDTPMKGFDADAQYSAAGLKAAGWSYDVQLPKSAPPPSLPNIAPYVWRAQKAADGTLSFSGFVPSDAFQRVAKSRAPAANDTTVLGAGAPSDFGTSALAGLDALSALDEGALALNGTHWTLTGGTATAASRDKIQAELSGQVDAKNWQIAIQAKDTPAVVTPYLWSATKAADGSVDLKGDVPTATLKTEAATKAATVSSDSTVVASGEPAGFADDLRAGLDALSHLRSGTASYDGSKWLLSGDVASAADGDAATAALAKGSKGGALWTRSLTGYPAASAEAALASTETPDITTLDTSSAPAVEASATQPSSEAASSSAEPSAEASSEQPSSASEQPALSSESSEQPAVSSEAPSSTAPVESSSSAAPVASSAEPASQEAVPAATAPAIPDTLVFEAIHPQGAAIALKGAVPAEAAQKYFGSIAGNVSTDALAVTPNLPDDFITNAIAGIESLGTLSDARLGFDGTRWWLRGKAKSEADKDSVTAKISALPKGADWSVAIDLMAPIDLCRISVDALAGRNAIVFAAGKAVLDKSSLPVLDELAKDLAACPATYVHVQGYTDADGDADANLALSVARSEAVVAALVERGIGEGRFYAEGYGENDPVAPNDTKQNKQRNRRIAFEIDAK
jgi:outer membrane protein OmpA-like peptidoglycan-associated protein/osmotically-inducible protein OsmY